MIKKLLAIASFVMASSAFAANPMTELMTNIQSQMAQDVQFTSGMDWKTGDENNYSVDMTIVQGTMKMSVREVGTDGIWVDQAMDLGFAGKQNAAILYDPNTGAVKKFLVNGKEQAIPENNFKPVDVHEDKVTVPAGSFDCIYAKLKDEKNGQEAEAWLNPEKVSVGGSLKMIQPSQFGKVTIALTSYKKN